MFCTFFPTGHLSFNVLSPHSTNESMLFTGVQGQKADFNIMIVYFCWSGGGGDMFKFNICVAVFLVKFSSTILKQCPLQFNNTQTF